VPPIRRKLPIGPNGRVVDAELADVQSSQESWSQYLLGDGTTLKLKVIVTEVWRAVGEYDNDGNPLYIAKSNNILVVNAPDELRKRQ
jgi:hypothetical protein